MGRNLTFLLHGKFHRPLKDAAARMENLQAMASVLTPGGTQVVETRNWEKVLRENRRFTANDRLSYREKDDISL